MLAIVKKLAICWVVMTLAGNLVGRMWQVGDHFMAGAIVLITTAWYVRWWRLGPGQWWRRDAKLPAGQSS